MAGPVRLLVASHDASRTGAPLVLLTFLHWVRGHTDAHVDLVLWRGGPLVEAFREVAGTVTVLHPPPGVRSRPETVEAGLERLGLGAVARWVRTRRIAARLPVPAHDVLYLNGAGSALVLPHLGGAAPTLAHVHELARGLTYSLRGPGRDRFLGAERVVAVSQVVADLLVAEWGVDPARVAVVPGCVPARPARSSVDPPVRARDGVPLVVAVGSGGWRKGIDLFLRVADGVREAGGEVDFAWVGPLEDREAVTDEAERSGLLAVLDLPGEVEDPSAWLDRAAVLVSTAREDPFPLVGLEAGAAGVPVVAFASGGLTELLADGRGTVVGPVDVAAMVEAVVSILADPARAVPGAERLRRHVATHHTPERMGQSLWAEVEALARRT